MRQPKYRGKRKDNGEWVYGYYFIEERDIEDGIIWRDIPQIQQRYGDHYQYFAVIPETVGEFTGLPDKDGKEIYEGDILKDANDDLYTCEWCIDKWLFSTKNCKSPQWMTWALKDMTIISNIQEVDS